MVAIEREHGDSAITWAMEELVEQRHKHKELDDHQTCEDLEHKVVEVVMGMLAYHGGEEL